MPAYSITIPQSQPDRTLAPTKVQGDNLPALLRQAHDSGGRPAWVRRVSTPRPKHCRIRESHRVTVFRQLADSFQSGMPLQESLRLIAHETHDAVAKNAVRRLLEQIQSGESFAEAARHSPELFTETDLAVIDAGERGSALGEGFAQLAEVTESTFAAAKSVGRAFIYPGIISFTVFWILTFMLLVNVPRFMAIFRDFGVSLPGPTQFIFDLSRLVAPMLLLLFIGALILLPIYLIFRRTWAGRLSFDFWKLRLPLMNHVFYRMAVARGCGMMSVLTRHAVPIMDALRLAGESCGNRAIQRGFEGAGIAIANGETLARSLEESEAFPETLIWQVALAESSGDVSDTFWRLSRHFYQQVDSKTQLFIAIIEPALILILGGGVGFIVISMFLPLIQIIWKLSE